MGQHAYAAAGGRTVKDLFDDSIAFLEDGDILQRLALDKAEALREALLTEGWGWVDTNLAGQQTEGLAAERLRPSERKLSAKEKRKLTAIEQEITEIDSALEALEDGPEAETLWDRREALDDARDAMFEAARFYEKDLMALAGASLGVDRDGKPLIQRGLIRRADLKALNKLRHKTSSKHSSDDDDDTASPPSGSSLSKALMRDLSLARTRAIRAGVAADAHVGLALLVALLSQQSMSSEELVGPMIQAGLHDFGDDDVFAALRAAHAFPSTFAEALALDDEGLLSCLAILVAESIDLNHEGASAYDQARQRSGDAIAAAIGLDMSAHWTPDSNFWRRTSKAYALQALAESSELADLPDAARNAKLKALAKLNKSAFAEATAKIVAQANWLPDCLVTPLGEGALALTDAAKASLAPKH